MRYATPRSDLFLCPESPFRLCAPSSLFGTVTSFCLDLHAQLVDLPGSRFELVLLSQVGSKHTSFHATIDKMLYFKSSGVHS